jgi:YegS/Rv2252/BmrU family lipid kinase
MMTEPSRRCAVVFNPTKVTDAFQTTVSERLRAAGWPDPIWLSTTEEDPGRGMTAEAVAAEVDLVIAAGGDGTVRIVADGLAGSGIPMGLVPAGTGNLLARNLGVPLDESKALDVAVEGRTRTIDLIKITADDRRAEHYAVMAGIGVDAVIMDETDPGLKAQIGSAAYFIAAARALGRLPIDLRIKIDDHHTHHRKAMICTIGNVGALTGNLTLIPGAKPDDGILNIYVASPHRFTHWLRVLVRLVTRRPHSEDHVDEWVGRRVELVLKEPDTYELDGDVLGETRRLVAEIQPGALVVCVPS